VNDLAMLLDAATTAARAAGAILRRRPSRVEQKGAAIDLVTEVDLASEAEIRAVLGRLCPDLPVQGEEGGGATTGLRWVVDPLDGTTNFVHDYPAYVVSIGLCDGALPLVGVLYDPLRDHLYTAARGLGAARNGAPLRVSDTRDLIRALAVTGFPYRVHDGAADYLALVARVLEQCQGLRRSGSAAFDLGTVAAGQADAFWEFGLNAWDTAAGAVIVREAGGAVTRLDGSEWAPGDHSVLATNGHVHDAMVALFAGLPTPAPPPRR
jgi:myo-inositol-1(or 4)-monophosphatase